MAGINRCVLEINSGARVKYASTNNAKKKMYEILKSFIKYMIILLLNYARGECLFFLKNLIFDTIIRAR